MLPYFCTYVKICWTSTCKNTACSHLEKPTGFSHRCPNRKNRNQIRSSSMRLKRCSKERYNDKFYQNCGSSIRKGRTENACGSHQRGSKAEFCPTPGAVNPPLEKSDLWTCPTNRYRLQESSDKTNRWSILTAACTGLN